jgi:uncharacterized membrane protein YuzA (DUF378 family)
MADETILVIVIVGGIAAMIAGLVDVGLLELRDGRWFVSR